MVIPSIIATQGMPSVPVGKNHESVTRKQISLYDVTKMGKSHSKLWNYETVATLRLAWSIGSQH
jgi:hypothetical protein